MSSIVTSIGSNSPCSFKLSRFSLRVPSVVLMNVDDDDDDDDEAEDEDVCLELDVPEKGKSENII